VTNAHVVRGAKRVTVTLHDNDTQPASDSAKTFPARIIGTDTETDLALLKVDRANLPFLTLGNSDRIRQGEIVIAFGSPLGLTNSMTMGMISAPARQLNEEDFVQYIQTDAAINPGNSGGPLVDTNGEVVGINTMILTQSGGNEGVGLAIPSNVVHSVTDQLKAQGHVHRGMIGITVQTVTPTLAEGLGIAESGALVGDLKSGGPADSAGLHIGDVVTKVDNAPIHSAHQLEQAVFRASTGDVLHMDVNSGGEAKTVTVTVADRPDDHDELSTLLDPKESLIRELGVLGVTLDQSTAALMSDLRLKSGVLVAAQAHEPTAWNSQLQPGDVIHEINGSTVTSIQFLKDKFASIAPGKAVVLQVERDGDLQYLSFRAE
jgi:serine protease Do